MGLVPVIASALIGFMNQGGMDAAQFERIIRSLHEQIHDVSLVFEGSERFVGPAGVKRPTDPDYDETFQGSYAYRADGSTWMDTYRRLNHADQELLHDTHTDRKSTRLNSSHT